MTPTTPATPLTVRAIARRIFHGILRPVIGTYLILLAMLYLGQEHIILRPPSEGQVSFIVPPTLQEHDWKPDGQYMGIVMEPKQGTPRATVVFFHGNADTSDDRQWVGATIARNNARVVLVEYPGFGRRSGKANTDEALAASQEAFEKVRAEFPGPLVLSGESFGSGMAAQVAGKQGSAVQGAVLFVPWDSLLSVVQEKLPFIPARLMLHHEFDSVKAFSHFKRPVLLAAAEFDGVIPNHHARTLAESTPSSRFEIIKGVGHGEWQNPIDDARWGEYLNFALGEEKTSQ